MPDIEITRGHRNWTVRCDGKTLARLSKKSDAVTYAVQLAQLRDVLDRELMRLDEPVR